MAEFVLAGMALGLIQVLAALPWIAVLDPAVRSWGRRALTSLLGVQVVAGTLAALAAGMALLSLSGFAADHMVATGWLYAATLHLQLMADLFVLVFFVLLRLWPQGTAVGLAAFRESMRQPMFWVLFLGALVMLGIAPFIPYFTFGEDFKMVQEIGYDTIMLAATAFGVVAASMSISEEIEGKTAITLMSKPISRRQFLLGKFVGILLAALAMTLLLGWFFIFLLDFKKSWDPWCMPEAQLKAGDPAWVKALLTDYDLQGEARQFVQGAGAWIDQLVSVGLGLVLGYGQLMVLLAIAVALATRLPMIVNLVVCLVVFFLGHLTPILVAVSRERYALVRFTAEVFRTVLPGLEFYDMGPAVVRDAPLPPADFAWYVLSLTGYSVLYTAIALLFGLILFEDRDLA